MLAFESCTLRGEKTWAMKTLLNGSSAFLNDFAIPQALANGHWLSEQRRKQLRTGIWYISLDMEP